MFYVSAQIVILISKGVISRRRSEGGRIERGGSYGHKKTAEAVGGGRQRVVLQLELSVVLIIGTIRI